MKLTNHCSPRAPAARAAEFIRQTSAKHKEEAMALKAVVSALVFWFSSSAFAGEEWPFNVSAYGNFKRMVHTGDASGKISLASIPHSAGTYGVGALADLQGEILVWDGRVFITPGESVSASTQPARAGDQAALLVTAQVTEWERVQVPRDMAQKEFERFVIDTAHSKGIDIQKPFPFIVMGEITDYAWHVVTGTAKGHGGSAQHHQSHANKRTFSGAETKGKLIGFFSGEELEGVISHPGERFHVHYADDDLKISGHLDSFGVRKWATLLLPKQ
jgi:alpha-acetolactate decarboxylase